MSLRNDARGAAGLVDFSEDVKGTSEFRSGCLSIMLASDKCVTELAPRKSRAKWCSCAQADP
jgi:hypothetical protein